MKKLGQGRGAAVSETNPFTNTPAECYDDAERELERFDPAWAKASLFFRSHGTHHFGHKSGQIRMQGLLSIHEKLNVFKKRIADGDTLSILQAVDFCATENLPLPTWLASMFGGALNEFLRPGGKTSLDEVFHSATLPTQTAKKAADAKQDWVLGGLIWREVWDAAHADTTLTSLDAALKAALKKKRFGVKLTKARELMLMVEKSQLEFLGHKESISRFLEKRRKASTN